MATLEYSRRTITTRGLAVLELPRHRWPGGFALLALFYLGLLSGRFTLGRLGGLPTTTDIWSQVTIWFFLLVLFGLTIRWSVWRRSPHYYPLQAKWLAAVIVFHLYIALSVLWAPRPDLSVFRLWELAVVIAYLLLAPALLNEDPSHATDTMIKFCFWTGAIYAAAGFYGSWWSLGRMAAFGGGPNIFARVIATAILASLYLWARTGKLRWLLAMPFLIPCLIASGSRGGVGSLAVTLPFALTTIIRASRRVRGLIIGSAITALVLSQWLWDTFADVWRFRFVELTFERQYAADRDLLYAQAWDVFLENKPFGIGLDGFSQVAAGVYPHNLFLQVLSEGGITGMLLLLIPFWFMLRRLTYRRTLGQTFAFWIGTFYLSSSMFSGTYLDSRFIWIFFLIAMTGVRTETLRPSDTKLLTKSPGAWLGGPPILSGRQ